MSTILITGATGFIGRHLSVALAAKGHNIVCGVRNPSAEAFDRRFHYIKVDYTQDFDVNIWESRLTGIDIVINAVGIIRETDTATFFSIHERAPTALFLACAELNIKTVQISALGADEQAQTRFHLSKKNADSVLLFLNQRSVVVQPSLVFGPGGESTKFFLSIASLPVIPLPGTGQQQIQPIHIDDLIDAIVVLVESNKYIGRRIPLVGPEPYSLQSYLHKLRQGMGLGDGIFLHIPLILISFYVYICQWTGKGLLNIESWQMLQEGNFSDPGVTTELLGRDPKAPDTFISPWNATELRKSALLSWLQPVLRVSLAIVWLVAGIVSMGIYPVGESYFLLARVGVPEDFAPLVLYGAASIDIIFGIGTLFLRRRKLLWMAQVILIILYTFTITLYLPEFWLHPFGPIIKNLPILAIIWLLYELEK